MRYYILVSIFISIPFEIVKGKYFSCFLFNKRSNTTFTLLKGNVAPLSKLKLLEVAISTKVKEWEIMGGSATHQMVD